MTPTPNTGLCYTLKCLDGWTPSLVSSVSPFRTHEGHSPKNDHFTKKTASTMRYKQSY